MKNKLRRAKQKAKDKLKVYRFFAHLERNPKLFIGIFILVGLISLIAVLAYSIPTKTVPLSLGSCSGSIRCYDGAAASNGSIAFNGGVTPQPVTGSILLPNTLEINKYHMNDRQAVATPTQINGTNIKIASYTLPGDNGYQGQFRVYCKYSHFNYDDPIVYPGQAGAAHLHMYWGNTAINANTTSANIGKYGGGTCDGFELNRTGYWMPALSDGNGNVIIPQKFIIYYKSGTRLGDAAKVSAMPKGLKMIAGNSKGNTTPTGLHNLVEWNCYDDSASWVYPKDAYGNTSGTTIPATCPPGYYLSSIVYFPQCWDGVGLERSDVQYATGDNDICPDGWKIMPQVSYHIVWPNSASYANWYLSSDRMPNMPVLKNGSTLHGDWFGGWDETIMNEWIKNCIQAMRNCGDGRLGDGTRSLMNFYPNYYEGPTYYLPKP